MYPKLWVKIIQIFDATYSAMNERLRFCYLIFTYKTKNEYYKTKIMKTLEDLKQTESNLLHEIEGGYAMLFDESSQQVISYISRLQSELMDVQDEIRNFKNNQ